MKKDFWKNVPAAIASIVFTVLTGLLVVFIAVYFTFDSLSSVQKGMVVAVVVVILFPLALFLQGWQIKNPEEGEDMTKQPDTSPRETENPKEGKSTPKSLQVTANNIKNSPMITGDNNEVKVNETPSWLVRIIITLLVIVSFIAGIVSLNNLHVRPNLPQTMEDEFNMAIAEFTVLDENGSPVKSDDGQEVAQWLFGRLETTFDEKLHTFPYELWPPAYTGQVTGHTEEERANNAESLAKKIGANVIIYGVIRQTDNDQSPLHLGFYVNYKGFEEAKEIIGEHALGSSLFIKLPFDTAQFQGVENPGFAARAQALSLLTIGLSYYVTDDFENALKYFAEAEATEGWSQRAGKEIVYLLLGHANVRQASKEKSSEYLTTASEHYNTALSINSTYTPAWVGLANVQYLMAQSNPADSSFDDVDLDKLDKAEDIFEAARNNLPESSNIETKIRFGLGQIYFVRAQIMGDESDEWLALAKAEFQQVVQAYKDGNKQVENLAGQAYACLGAMAELEGNTRVARKHYRRATKLVTPYYQAYYYTLVSKIHADSGQSELAIEANEQAIQIAEYYNHEESAEKFSRREALLKEWGHSIPIQRLPNSHLIAIKVRVKSGELRQILFQASI